MKTKLITREGYNKLKAEHDHLWNEKRPEITKIVTWAASLGDRSENADYTFNKRLLRQIDRRVRFLRKFLPEVTHRRLLSSARRKGLLRRLGRD